MHRWRDRVAVVTGGSQGIGEAIVRHLAASGMKVAALARRQELLEALERDIKSKAPEGKVKSYICDVTSVSDVNATFRSIVEDFGYVSVLINNAGVLRPIHLTGDTEIEDFKLMLDTNLVGVLNCTKAGIESMKLHSVNDGHIFNISSVAAHKLPDHPEYAGYFSTKHALKVLTESLRRQIKQENTRIRISHISPGLVKTAMTDKLINEHNLSGYLEPSAIADAVAYALAAPSNVNVSEITVEPF